MLQALRRGAWSVVKFLAGAAVKAVVWVGKAAVKLAVWAAAHPLLAVVVVVVAAVVAGWLEEQEFLGSQVVLALVRGAVLIPALAGAIGGFIVPPIVARIGAAGYAVLTYIQLVLTGISAALVGPLAFLTP